MLVYFKYCNNCGTEYKYQASGGWALKTPQRLNSDKYCPSCKEIELEYLDKMNIAFKEIPKVSQLKQVLTTEVDLDTLLEWEKLNHEDIENEAKSKGQFFFPLVRKVFSSLYSSELKEWERVAVINGRDDKKGRYYTYYYYPSQKDEAKITVKARVSNETGEIISYK